MSSSSSARISSRLPTLQNDRLYAGGLPEGSRIHLRRMKPAGVYGVAAVASDGSKSLLVFTEEGVKVNTHAYIKMLTE